MSDLTKGSIPTPAGRRSSEGRTNRDFKKVMDERRLSVDSVGGDSEAPCSSSFVSDSDPPRLSVDSEAGKFESQHEPDRNSTATTTTSPTNMMAVPPMPSEINDTTDPGHQTSDSPVMMSVPPMPSEIRDSTNPGPQTPDEQNAVGNDGETIPDDPECKVYIGNLAWATTFQTLKRHCSQAGVVAFAGVLSEGGRINVPGKSRGSGFVIFETGAEANAAVELLNGTELDGRKIAVDRWTGSWKAQGGPPAHLAAKGYGQPDSREKSYRSNCQWPNWMHVPGFGGRGNRTWVRMPSRPGKPDQSVWVGNLPWKATWKDLKEHMAQEDPAAYAKVMTEYSWLAGSRSRGMGFVEYSDTEGAATAVVAKNGTELLGRPLVVDHWVSKGR